MRLIGRKRLADFCEEHGDARDWVSTWISDVEAAAWKSPHDIRKKFASVSFLGDGKVIFNVKGNKYRLIAIVAYQTQLVLAHWVGTHAEYDKQDFLK